MNYAKGITYCRERAGLRQVQLAKMVGISPAYMSMLEADAGKKPSNKLQQKIANACKVSVAVLLIASLEDHEVPASNKAVFQSKIETAISLFLN